MMRNRKLLEIGGILASLVLVAFGIGAIVMGFQGRSTVSDNLKTQQIVGTPDMTPAAITAEAKKAGLNPAKITIPSCSVAKQTIDSGSNARCFAQYMNIHSLEATGGLYYAQMPRYATADGKGTNVEALALKKNGQPVDNPARDVWINETALATALNTSYMADQISLFGIVVGVALLLAGLGFAVLSIGGALRNPDGVLKLSSKRDEAGATPAPAPGA
jgi:hypothetical protein